ncbi:Transcription repressor OFP14 [Ananas comosus]|uniref:Transcription repressor n=1 Tax=Ananas comosus TaxID=4615 RepID=A0A199W665_ANACO|nr:Transcription repressor OFP14 [Ananas comosus]
MNSMGRSKKLQLYLSKKLRRSVPNINIRIQFRARRRTAEKPVNLQYSTSWLLSACKYPKTPSFAVSRHNDDDAADAADAAAAHGATLSDVDRFLHENFHSLYIRDPSDVTDAASSPPRFDPEPGPVRSSDRFFVSPATTSNSIMLDRAGPATSASSSSSEEEEEEEDTSAAEGGEDDVAAAAVVTFSKDPYEDFRRSMREMVDARRVDASQPLDWDFMEELLFCYLELNDKSVHKYILTAFTDLTVSFRRPRDPAVSADAGTEQRRRRRTRTKAAAAAAAVRL